MPGVAHVDAARLTSLRGQETATLHLPLPEGGELTLRLTRTEPVLPDAVFVVATHTARGVVERPARFDPGQDLRVLRGEVEGHPGSLALITISETFTGGFIRLSGEETARTLLLSSGAPGAPRADAQQLILFDPALLPEEARPSGESFCQGALMPPNAPALPDPRAAGGVAGEPGSVCRELLFAIDTDVEYTANLFGGNETAALAYTIALLSTVGEIYAADLDLRLHVAYIRLWEGEDPWNQGGSTSQLFQYRDWWLEHETQVPRDLAHFFSGRSLGGGVAWLSVVCNDEYHFGLSGNLNGSFPYPLAPSDQNWDLMVVAHEIGHNVGSPHTHDYNPPLDGCGLGDCSGALGGTIMSYCHTCPGGLANISLSFHPGNIASIFDHLDLAKCLAGSSATPAAAHDDYVTVGAGESAEVDALLHDELANCEAIELDEFDSFTAKGLPVSLVSAPPDGRMIFTVAVPSDAQGLDSFGYSIIDAAGSGASASVFLDVIPILAALPVSGDLPGTVANYYNVGDNIEQLPDFDLLTPYFVDVVPAVDFPSTNGAFATSGLADFVGAVFEGWVRVPTTGFWTFFLDSDDGSKLFIADQLVIDNDGLHGMLERSGFIGLAAGAHPIRIEFFERGGGAGCIARLAGPDFPKQAIPASLWSHGGTLGGGADLNGDGVVDGADLGLLLAAWGSAGSAGDLNGDGTVDGADLGILLSAWGTPG